MLRAIGLTALFTALAGQALAHAGPDTAGFLHPFSGADHVLAAVGVGAWAFLLANRRAAPAILVPAAFLVMMAAGAVAGFAGTKLPLGEAAILASVVSIGGLIALGVRLPAAVAMAVVGAFAVFHGYAHAVEAPSAAPADYILGLGAATAVLAGTGFALAGLTKRMVGELGPRALGGLVVAGGALIWAAT